MSERQSTSDGKIYWLDQPSNVNKLVGLLIAVCVGLALLDAVYVKHGHFAFEEAFPLFYGVYGFLAYCFIVLSAKALRRLLKRDENYYDR
ncbi:MAG: hypothetical protein IAF00_05380 [Phycisphaerales bacterium]|nr:hypothetical protein [Phycisphaerales bacterium]